MYGSSLPTLICLASMDGLALAAAARARWEEIEIIVTSGNHGAVADKLPDRSVFIAKPYKFDRVVECFAAVAAVADRGRAAGRKS